MVRSWEMMAEGNVVGREEYAEKVKTGGKKKERCVLVP